MIRKSIQILHNKYPNSPIMQKAATIFKLTDTNFGAQLTGVQDHGTGYLVSPENMLYASAVWTAIRVISETIAVMPMEVYRWDGQYGVVDPDHPLYKRFNSKPNRYETDIEFKEQIAMSLCIYEAAYVKPEMFGNRGVFTVLHPNCVSLLFDDDHEPYWMVSEKGETKKYQYDKIIRIKSWGGIGTLEGFATKDYGRHVFALALAADKFSAKFFGSGGRLTGVVSTDKPLSKEQGQKIKDYMSDFVEARDVSQGKIKILGWGLKYQPIASSNDEAQLDQIRKHQIREVARIWRIPLHMMMEAEGSGYGNNEPANRQFFQLTLHPYIERIKKSINNHLFEGSKHYVDFNPRSLLRPDAETASKIYTAGRQAGYYTSNEIRAWERLPPKEGGDRLDMPLNSNKSDKQTSEGNENANS